MTTSENYCIPASYSSRTFVRHHDDRGYKDEWQEEVYSRARGIARDRRFDSVLDVGCGSGYKLLKHFSDLEVRGWELPPALEQLRARYPQGHWERSDLARRDVAPVDMVICSDVIEHLVDPDELMSCLAAIPCRVIVLSTPARELLPAGQGGPPHNPCHAREWSCEEFGRYARRYFSVFEHAISNRAQATQYVVCGGSQRLAGTA